MKNFKPLQLFCSDLDGTLLGHPGSTHRFKKMWESISPRQRPLLCYSTGRFKEEIYDIVDQKILPYPDYVISAVGTRLYKGNVQEEIVSFRKALDEGWDLEKVKEIVGNMEGLIPQPDHYQNAHKSSWYLEKDDPAVVNRLKELFLAHGLEVSIIYSSGRDLDILPARAGKGKALKWMCSKLHIPLKRVIVAGNTGNDTSMFLIDGVRGIVVSNAKPELFRAVDKKSCFHATRSIADGVIEGLKHFGVNFAAAISNRTTSDKKSLPKLEMAEK